MLIAATIGPFKNVNYEDDLSQKLLPATMHFGPPPSPRPKGPPLFFDFALDAILSLLLSLFSSLKPHTIYASSPSIINGLLHPIRSRRSRCPIGPAAEYLLYFSFVYHHSISTHGLPSVTCWTLCRILCIRSPTHRLEFTALALPRAPLLPFRSPQLLLPSLVCIRYILVSSAVPKQRRTSS